MFMPPSTLMDWLLVKPPSSEPRKITEPTRSAEY
jgi:hypothetical protein